MSWREISVRDLVAGDVIQLPEEQKNMFCDCLLLKGSVLCNEAGITGEPMDVSKFPIEKSVGKHTTIGPFQASFGASFFWHAKMRFLVGIWVL